MPPRRFSAGWPLISARIFCGRRSSAIEEVATALQALQRARVLRDEILKELWNPIKQVKRGLLADPEHGPNGFLVKIWGDKREEDYDSGLTRRLRSDED